MTYCKIFEKITRSTTRRTQHPHMPLDEATKHTLRAFFAQDPHLSKQGAEKLCNDLALSCTAEQVYRWFANQRNKPDRATRKRCDFFLRVA
jgi:hypothetical protein